MANMNTIMREDAMTIFSEETLGNVRAFRENGEPWFVAKDVCDILDIKNSRDATANLDDDEKGVANTDTLGGKQVAVVINTSGLYTLILKSRKPQAKAFKRWVTHIVLPSIMEGKNSAGAHAYIFGQEDETDPEAEKALQAAAKVKAAPPEFKEYVTIGGMVMSAKEALEFDLDGFY